MRPSLTLVAATVISILAADAAMAQPVPYGGPGRPPAGPPPGQIPPRGPQAYNYHYYNGRWLGQDEWQRRAPERDRWARNYERRHGYYGYEHYDHDHDDSSAIIAGIIGFALGAAIVGSAQQAEHARTADESWDDYCARKYRSYDRHSRTYLGADGLRHYCQ